ncbi:type I restriction endonuclease subunit R [Microvirga sp. STR05]|uniref:Type I restriction enzyme endonuclease subunit n=1 Tax=Hymenobacter duratus TaxID=2771356 RepID=A0ABR8JLW2_9BACT|nr:type I restriction endonuclease subunit R [Hymenobacter duratus]MBD2716711.1 type I restriction endonuclease subunit R [Hymenobacter duratus]MBR7951626.1 type I restriction endonuclease subunit R [Microvirga sp. STR05]
MVSESALEEEALKWFHETGWPIAHGPDVSPNGPTPERSSYKQAHLPERLLRALRRLNPNLSEAVVQEAAERVVRAQDPLPVESNRLLHGWLTDGVPVDVPAPDGGLRGDRAWLVDFNDVERNDWLVISQFRMHPNRRHRTADLVCFLNGLPVAVLELKDPLDREADVWKAHEQLQTYRQELPDLFLPNVALVVSDGRHARVGSLTADKERFMPWRTIRNERDQPQLEYELETVVRGFFDRALFLDYLRHFVLFEPGADGTLIKKIAAYHQFHAVRTAVQATIRAAATPGTTETLMHDEPEPYAGRLLQPDRAQAVALGSRKGGIVWHTQGSGKSISMACFAGKLRQQPEMRNPTLVVVTDRNDLDGQLFQQFANAQSVLKEAPVQAYDREHLRALLADRPSGGVFFTTIQKFSPLPGEKAFPQLSDRTNIVVIADEAHRSQYGLSSRLDKKSGEYKTGFARHLRNALPLATFVGFTGTPLETDDADTRQVFGPYVSVYDIEDAVRDGATVPIYYESRLAELHLVDDVQEIAEINEEVEEVLESEEDVVRREQEKARWTKLEKVIGAESRLALVAQDIVTHFEERSAAGNIQNGGKAMIVGMSRDICARLYTAIVKLRPEWHDEDPKKGVIKVVMTGSAADKEHIKQHVYAPGVRKQFEKRFKNPADELRLVIVRDMWLTGFDVLSLHTMYIDKPMQAHNLMQAIARVNRVFKNKAGGLIVDYIGIATELKRALKTYTAEGGKTGTEAVGTDTLTIDVDQALKQLQEAVRDVRYLLRGAEYMSTFLTESLSRLREVSNYVLELEEEKRKEFFDRVLAATKAYGLCSSLDEAKALDNEVAFYKAVRGFITESSTPEEKLDHEHNRFMLKFLLDRAIYPTGVQSVFTLAGVQAEPTDISILSDTFLDEMRDLPQRHLAVELLQKLLHDQIHARTRTNLVQEKLFTDRLDKTIEDYRNRVIRSAVQLADLVDHLVVLAKELREADQRGVALGLNTAEMAFYDALNDNGSAGTLGADVLRKIAAELLDKIKRNASIDWQKRESVRARLRNLVRITLRRYHYPPDKQEDAIDLVLEQAERMADVISNDELPDVDPA